MKTIVATALAEDVSQEALDRLVSELRARLGDAQPALVAAFASIAHPLDAVMQHLAAAFPSATLLGASTAGEFTEARDAKRALVVFALAGEHRVFSGMATGLRGDAEGAVSRALDGLPRELPGYPHRTALMLLDPLAGNAEEATLIAASMLDDMPLAGGAAGDDLQMKQTHVACGTRVSSDAIVVAALFSKSPIGLGVRHGHEPLSSPMRVTRAEGNVVHELDGRPAWDVWREATRERAKAHGIDVDRLSDADVGAFLLRYEAGLAAGREYKIRAPLSRDASGAIQFACGIPQGSVIRITESIPARQIDSAREAARRAREQLSGHTPAGALVFDCICRNLILDREFRAAVSGMSEELSHAPLAGFETYGEIALAAGDMSGFHNTTSVVLAFAE